MAVEFAERLAAIQAKHKSQIALLMRPRLLQMPLPVQRFDDPFLPFARAIIDATRDVVCAYVFDLAAHLSLGAAGAVALERSIAAVGGEVITLLHGPFASGDYAEAASAAAFNVDAVTVTDEEFLEPYSSSTTRGAFVVRRGENPVIIPLPGNAGVYWQDADLFTMLSESGHLLQMRLAGERVLYAGRGDDFAGRVRAAVERMRV